MSSDEDAVVDGSLKRDFEEISEIGVTPRGASKKVSMNAVYDAIRTMNGNLKNVLDNQVLLDSRLIALEGKVGSNNIVTTGEGINMDSEQEDEDEDQAETPANRPEYTNIVPPKIYELAPEDIPLVDKLFTTADLGLMKTSRKTFNIPRKFSDSIACPCNSGPTCFLAPHLVHGYTSNNDVPCDNADCCHFFFSAIIGEMTDMQSNPITGINPGSFELGSGTFNYQQHSLHGQTRGKLLAHLLYTHHMTVEQSKKYLPFLANHTHQKRKKEHEQWFVSKFINAGNPILCKPTRLTDPPTNAEVAAGNETV
ncbi:predicted protein [Chaetoceros tenuissimus]|uniref:Uncharacterized protein n=1 Tax=Chaetoceros tenuissimus TaxID=426638 RepID=A0AAD3H2E2_9STRA|nr:predicted protein [Chaetoceros tenuissimus]